MIFQTPKYSTLQQSWAELTGHLMIEEGFIDYRLAKAKAAKQLGLVRGSPEPSIAAIEAAALAYYEQHRQPQDIRWHIEQLDFAQASLSKLNAYHPKLAGTLLKHRPNALDEIELHTYMPTAEVVLDELYARDLSVNTTAKRYRLSDGTTHLIPTYAIAVGEFVAALVVFTEVHHGLKPLSPVTLQPIQTWTTEAIQIEIACLQNLL